MLGNLTGWHFLAILVVVLLLFGAPKLPGLARSLGQSMNILREFRQNKSTAQATDATTKATTANSDIPVVQSTSTAQSADSTVTTTKPTP